MADFPEEIYYIWLAKALGAGSRFAAEVLRRHTDVREFYASLPGALKEFDACTESIKKRLLSTKLDSAAEIFKQCGKAGCRLITCRQSSYPERLLNIQDFPPVLYAKGNFEKLAELNARPAIAVVGTRKPSPYAESAARFISYDLARAGFAVLSGLAAGIDFAAHAECMRAKGLTAAFAGCGVDIDYPKPNNILRSEIEKRGIILSEFPPGTPPMKGNFPVRNRLLSGAAVGVLVVEGGLRSGSLITAAHAVLQDRDVFALPGDIFDSRSEGAFWLIQDGAAPVMSALDIVIHYLDAYPDRLTAENIRPNFFSPALRKNPPDVKIIKPEIRKNNSVMPKNKEVRPGSNKGGGAQVLSAAAKAPPDPGVLSANAQKILSLMGAEPAHADELQESSGLSPTELLAAMTELELEGFAENQPGRMYLRLT
ncbi:MAG: DNA-processing protein DprA [Oscillospiraceae bacterium]|nr:DNA-processing protein DprA [Oscillospiraceae bacterium]